MSWKLLINASELQLTNGPSIFAKRTTRAMAMAMAMAMVTPLIRAKEKGGNHCVSEEQPMRQLIVQQSDLLQGQLHMRYWKRPYRESNPHCILYSFTSKSPFHAFYIYIKYRTQYQCRSMCCISHFISGHWKGLHRWGWWKVLSVHFYEVRFMDTAHTYISKGAKWLPG